MRPNILLITIDDLGYDWVPWLEVNRAEGRDPVMPFLERVRNAGEEWTLYTHPTCRPSRASLLTGLEPHKHGFGHSQHEPSWSLAFETLPEKLHREYDYHTALIGKWHLGPDDKDEWFRAPIEAGWNYFAGVNGNVKDYYSYEWFDGERVTTESTYLTDQLWKHFGDAIQSKGKPWFVEIAASAVHEPFHTPPGSNAATPDDQFRDTAEYLDGVLAQCVAMLDETARRNTWIYVLSDNGSPVEVSAAPVGSRKGSLGEGGVRTWMLRCNMRFGALNNIEPVPIIISYVPEMILGHAREGGRLPPMDSRVFSEKFKPNGPRPYEEHHAMVSRGPGSWKLRRVTKPSRTRETFHFLDLDRPFDDGPPRDDCPIQDELREALDEFLR